MIPVGESFAIWRKDPKYMAVYNALEDEFLLAETMSQRHEDGALTKEQLRALR
jgi:hypothetical protein